MEIKKDQHHSMFMIIAYLMNKYTVTKMINIDYEETKQCIKKKIFVIKNKTKKLHNNGKNKNGKHDSILMTFA